MINVLKNYFPASNIKSYDLVNETKWRSGYIQVALPWGSRELLRSKFIVDLQRKLGLPSTEINGHARVHLTCFGKPSRHGQLHICHIVSEDVKSVKGVPNREDKGFSLILLGEKAFINVWNNGLVSCHDKVNGSPVVYGYPENVALDGLDVPSSIPRIYVERTFAQTNARGFELTSNSDLDWLLNMMFSIFDQDEFVSNFNKVFMGYPHRHSLKHIDALLSFEWQPQWVRREAAKRERQDAFDKKHGNAKTYFDKKLKKMKGC